MLISCPDCGGLFAETDAAPHAYMGGSPGCWASFNEVLAREFQDAAYFAVHRFTVNAYATQHPGDQSDRRAAQSIYIHLTALCALFEQNRKISDIPGLLKTLAKNYKSQFKPLTPPAPDCYALTVIDVLKAGNAQQHCKIVREWAQSVWLAFEPHHHVARAHIERVS